MPRPAKLLIVEPTWCLLPTSAFARDLGSSLLPGPRSLSPSSSHARGVFFFENLIRVNLRQAPRDRGGPTECGRAENSSDPVSPGSLRNSAAESEVSKSSSYRRREPPTRLSPDPAPAALPLSPGPTPLAPPVARGFFILFQSVKRRGPCQKSVIHRHPQTLTEYIPRRPVLIMLVALPVSPQLGQAPCATKRLDEYRVDFETAQKWNGPPQPVPLFCSHSDLPGIFPDGRFARMRNTVSSQTHLIMLACRITFHAEHG